MWHNQFWFSDASISHFSLSWGAKTKPDLCFRFTFSLHLQFNLRHEVRFGLFSSKYCSAWFALISTLRCEHTAYSTGMLLGVENRTVPHGGRENFKTVYSQEVTGNNNWGNLKSRTNKKQQNISKKVFCRYFFFSFFKTTVLLSTIRCTWRG